ncbi:MAG: hypothetical protein ACRDWY_01180 [Actinomycetes bacterium]
MTDGARSFGSRPPHGTLAEEAAKLAEVAQSWLRERSGQASDDPWAAATAGEDAGSECIGCPVCRAKRFVRDLNPEVLAHLSDAAGSLAAAVHAMSTRDGTTGQR